MSAAIYRIARRSMPFTQIDRKTLQDNSLTFEARGLLAYLLSKPDDWEVRPSVVAKDGNIGRDKLRRIEGELIEAGYMQRERVRDPATGAWLNSRTMIYERPQPKLEAANEGDDSEDVVDDADSFDMPNKAASTADCAIYAETPVASPPQTENPHVAEPHVENTSVDRHKKEYTNNSPLRPPTPQSDAGSRSDEAQHKSDPFWTDRIASDWRRFEVAWSFDPTEDSERVKRAFAKLSDADRDAAIRHAPDHAKDCERKERRKGSARNFIAARLFDPWARGVLAHPKPQVFVQAGTPAFEAWEARWRWENGRPATAKLFTIERMIDGQMRKGTLRASLYPPPWKRESAATTTDPPEEMPCF